MFALVGAVLVAAASQLAVPTLGAWQRLRESPSIYLADAVLTNATVVHVASKVEALPQRRWTPCIGQTQEFASKRCLLLRVAGDAVLEDAVAAIGRAYDIDVSALHAGGLPIIRYLPGAPAVAVHGDVGATGVVPNATLVLYLTDGEPAMGGRTFFPSAQLKVAPRRGSCLSFANGDPAARHGVEPLSAHAPSDRLVVQIPLLQRSAGARGVAYPEHVSGAKHKAHSVFIMLLLGGMALWVAWTEHTRAVESRSAEGGEVHGEVPVQNRGTIGRRALLDPMDRM